MNGHVTVGKEFIFHAAHRDERADDKCARPHGHTYRLVIEASGQFHKGDHMLVHGNVLKDLYRESIEPMVEHQDLNITCPYNPTMENVLLWITDIVIEAFKPIRSIHECRVRLWETPTMYAEATRRTI